LTKAKMLVQFDADIETTRAKLESDKSTLAEEKEKLKRFKHRSRRAKSWRPPTVRLFTPTSSVVEAVAISSSKQARWFANNRPSSCCPDPTRMQVKAKINESRISSIREWHAGKNPRQCGVKMNCSAVVKVNKYAEPGNWWGSNVKEYATFIQIMEPSETIRTGMTAEVRIFVEQIEDAVQRPVHAVYETKRHHFVLVSKRATGFANPGKSISVRPTTSS
jgi:hypothetical protein